MEKRHRRLRRKANASLKNPRAHNRQRTALMITEYEYIVLQRRPVVGACIGDRCRKKQVTAEAVYLIAGHAVPLYFVLRGPGAWPWTKILNPRLWIVLLASRGFLEDARTRSARGPDVFGPQDKVASGLPCCPCWLCRKPVANQICYQGLRTIDMSCFQCWMKHVQSGVPLRMPPVGAGRVTRAPSKHREDW